MADIPLSGGKTLRSVTINGKEYAGYLLGELQEIVVAEAGGALRYTIDDSPAVPINSPTAAARYCRIRIYHQTQDPAKRLFYRSDGTNPLADGTNAHGFLVHLDSYLIKQAVLDSFVMCGETASGNFEVYAEFFNLE